MLFRSGTNWNVVGGAQDSGWVTIANGALSNSWVNNTGAGGAMAMAYRKVGNRVTMIGGINDGASAAAAFTLPAGYRPQQAIQGAPSIGSGEGSVFPAQINVSTAGVVTFFYPVGATGTPMFFDGFSFLTD